MLSCFPFPDIFVKSANRDANISHPDLHSEQLDLCSCCVITKMNHCHVSSKAWQDGDFSAGKCQLNPAPTALMTPTAYFVFITEKKNIQQKKVQLWILFFARKNMGTSEAQLWKLYIIKLQGQQKQTKNFSSIFFEKQNKDARKKCVHTHKPINCTNLRNRNGHAIASLFTISAFEKKFRDMSCCYWSQEEKSLVRNGAWRWQTILCIHSQASEIPRSAWQLKAPLT